MAYMGSGESGRGIKLKESNNYRQGRTGAKDPILPAVVKSVRHNATQGGGINRATKGTGAGKSNY